MPVATRGRAAAATHDVKAPKKASTVKKNKPAVEPPVQEDVIEVVEPPRKPTRKTPAAVPAASVPAPVRRRIKVTKLNQEVLPAPELELSTVKTTSRSKKTTKAAASEEQGAETKPEAPKQKPRTRKALVPKSVEDGEAPQRAPTRTRGRPKKMVEPEVQTSNEDDQPKRTRASGTAATRSTAATIAKALAASKKKVTFQDVSQNDKENQPMLNVTDGEKKTATPATGLRAKPLRKPASTVTRGKKASTLSKSGDIIEAPKPLSPKKATQVAKSVSSMESEDDELNGAKTPIKAISNSPVKNDSPGKRLDFTTSIVPKSPTKGFVSSITASPARRPPPSPFKDAMKESPKKVNLGKLFPQSPIRTVASTPQHSQSSQPSLMQSARRGPLDQNIFSLSAFKPSKSAMKTSLLQSPAKRPVSPMKMSTQIGSPTKFKDIDSPAKVLDFTTTSPDAAVSCNFRASPSPERSIKVHKLTPEEFTHESAATVDFDASVLDVRSPVKISRNAFASELPFESLPQHDEIPTITNDLAPSVDTTAKTETDSPSETREEVAMLEEGSPMEGVECTAQVEDDVTADEVAAPVTAAFLIRNSRFREEDESSEDELSVDATPARMMPLTTDTPSHFADGHMKPPMSTIRPLQTTGNLGFTPLAVQFSTWLASSPDKQVRMQRHIRGVFGSPQIPREQAKVMNRRQSNSSRQSGVPRQSLAPRGSSAPRASIGLSNDTPQKSTFFEDEMVMRDLEEEVENVEVVEEEVVIYEEDNEQPLEDEFEEDTEGLSLVQFDELVCNHTSQESEISTFYGDENEPVPDNGLAMDEQLLSMDSTAEPQQEEEQEEAEDSEYRGPMKEFDNQLPVEVSATIQIATPVRPESVFPRVIHTVSKVPLRPEGFETSVRVPRKRSRSLSAGPPAVRKSPAPGVGRSNTVISLSPDKKKIPLALAEIEDEDGSYAARNNGQDVENELPPVPGSGIWSTVSSPMKTPKKDVAFQALQGAVVFVDVHTTEGADASGIFVELLTQMGARCVKQWSWNPRASTNIEAGEQPDSATSGKIGITHVVYKDGGKRTLEKVRDTKGVVLCIGVNWVLEYVFSALSQLVLFADCSFPAVNDTTSGLTNLNTLST